MKLTKNSVHEVKIEALNSQGAGIARIDGQVIFIPGAIKEEECTVKLLKVRKNVAYGKIEELLTESPHRMEPLCPYYRKCGGCDFWHMDYMEELRAKEERVNDALSRIGGLEIRVGGISAARSRIRYRNKAIFAVGIRDGLAVTGFYRAASHDIIPIDSCLIQHEAAERAAGALRHWMNEYSISAYNERDGRGLIRHIFIRSVSSGTGICVVTNGRPPHIDELIAGLLKSVPETVSISLCINRKAGNTVLPDAEIETIFGAGYVEAELMGRRFRLSPRSFYQVNSEQTEVLYGKVLEYADLSGKEGVLDLYCGTGTIGLCAAEAAGHITGIEAVASAVRDAAANARRNGIGNAEFIHADAERAAEELRKRGELPDVIILDPPRKGLTPGVINAAAGMGPERIIYVSCDPATLARDIKLFYEQGYICTAVHMVDMFPLTAHVECVVCLNARL